MPYPSLQISSVIGGSFLCAPGWSNTCRGSGPNDILEQEAPFGGFFLFLILF